MDAQDFAAEVQHLVSSNGGVAFIRQTPGQDEFAWHNGIFYLRNLGYSVTEQAGGILVKAPPAGGDTT